MNTLNQLHQISTQLTQLTKSPELTVLVLQQMNTLLDTRDKIIQKIKAEVNLH